MCSHLSLGAGNRFITSGITSLKVFSGGVKTRDKREGDGRTGPADKPFVGWFSSVKVVPVARGLFARPTMTRDTDDPTELGAHGHAPKDETGVTVFEDVYECPSCHHQFSVTDHAHRTHVGYDSATVRCEQCEVGMVRVE
jgi:predicted Zn finger-like uncharacterized protein